MLSHRLPHISSRTTLILAIAFICLIITRHLYPALIINVGSVLVTRLALTNDSFKTRSQLFIGMQPEAEEWLSMIAATSTNSALKTTVNHRLALLHLLSDRRPPEMWQKPSIELDLQKETCNWRQSSENILGAKLARQKYASQQVLSKSEKNHWQEAICWYRLLRFESDSIPLPKVRRAYLRALGRYQLDLLTSGRGGELKYALKLLWLAEDLDAIYTLVNRIKRDPELAQLLDESLILFYQGWVAEQNGDLTQALEHYRESTSLDKSVVEAVLGYFRVAKALNAEVELENARVMLQNLQASKQPWNFMPSHRSFPNTFDSGLRLVGFTLSDQVLIGAGVVHGYLFWESPLENMSAEGNMYPIGNSRWIQELVDDNKVPDPGFEWMHEKFSTPGLLNYARPSEALRYDTTLAKDHPDLSFVSYINVALPKKLGGIRISNFSVEPGQVLLVGVWMKLDPSSMSPQARLSGQARFWWSALSGIHKHVSTEPLPIQLVEPYPLTVYADGLSDLDGREWFYSANLVVVPPDYDSASVELAINMVNYNGQGTVYFDELLIVPLSVPME